jgi:hypothetical protein
MPTTSRDLLAPPASWRQVGTVAGLVGAVTGALLLVRPDAAAADLLAAQRYPQAVLAAEASAVPDGEEETDAAPPLDRLPRALRSLLEQLAVDVAGDAAEEPPSVPERLEHVQARDPRRGVEPLSRSLRLQLARFRDGSFQVSRRAGDTAREVPARGHGRVEEDARLRGLAHELPQAGEAVTGASTVITEQIQEPLAAGTEAVAEPLADVVTEVDDVLGALVACSDAATPLTPAGVGALGGALATVTDPLAGEPGCDGSAHDAGDASDDRREPR